MLARSVVVASLAALSVSAAAHAGFTDYIIRSTPTIQTNNVYVPGAKEFIIAAGGQKAAWGTNDQNGATVGQLTQLAITRHDDSTRFGAGSGPAVAPFLNIWITDGVNFAVVANEPSNPSFAPFRTAGPNGGYTYSFSTADIANEPANIYETTAGPNSQLSWVHVALGKQNQQLKWSDIANFTIAAPSAAYISGPNGVGSGAPREIGTLTAYGINWVFGDTLSNYVSGAEGYVVSNPIAIPAPGALALAGVGGLIAARRRRTR